jgi:hypothetical protein
MAVHSLKRFAAIAGRAAAALTIIVAAATLLRFAHSKLKHSRPAHAI